ncbi:hypothetical protein BJ944DRAFT_266165 [Cunninghamella echinulata]|nr:hypothetical protein BJ944DRAFT_266165 [Cunninghamella echinulata]
MKNSFYFIFHYYLSVPFFVIFFIGSLLFFHIKIKKVIACSPFQFLILVAIPINLNAVIISNLITL